MPRTWLILDVSCLAYKAYYGTVNRSPEDRNVACVRGMARTTGELESTFGTQNVVFAFDHPESHRKQKYSWYKANRAVYGTDPIRADARRQVRRQCAEMREKLLSRIGYKNVLYCPGVEADDMIAAAVDGMTGTDRAVIVSSDRDLYQLLAADVSIYNPHDGRTRTLEGFLGTYGIEPSRWPMFRALTGDESDNIPGIRGIGDVKASQYLRGKLNQKSSDYANIQEWVQSEQYKINLEVIKLPHPKTPRAQLTPHAPVRWGDWLEALDPRPTQGLPQ